MRDRSVTFRCFIRALVDQLVPDLAPSIPSVLRSVRLSPDLNATMTSADFPRPLSPGISLGQCRPCPLTPSGSTATVDDFSGFARPGLLAPGERPHCQFVFLRSKVRLRSFGAGPLRFQPDLRLRLFSSPRRGLFTPSGPAPARHTSAPVLWRFSGKAPNRPRATRRLTSTARAAGG
jgi:hypothetical protein